MKSSYFVTTAGGVMFGNSLASGNVGLALAGILLGIYGIMESVK